MMNSEQRIEDETSSWVPNEVVNGPLAHSDASVGSGTKSTGDTPSQSFVPEPVTPPMTAVESESNAVLGRAESSPPLEDEPMRKVQEAMSETGVSPKTVVSEKTSTPTVDPILLPPNGQLSSLSEGEFEEFINSPRGQNVIVERSPGGRYVRFMEKLGSGASKDVYRAYDTTEGIEVAWNVVNLAGVPKAERNRIVNEVRLLERLHHHNIISFHGSWVNRERQEVNFVTEILSSGTLKSFIDKVQVIRWKIAKRWAVQILNGLAYLHEQDPPVIHRDLKCDNIFINGTSGDLRIGDLGLSTVHRNGKVLSVLGTPEFMAPDLYEESSYDEKVDIYAFGLVLLEIFTKDIPYRECVNPAQIYRKVMRGEPPDSLARVRSKEARDFITLCLGYKDEETGKYMRPSAAELLTHSFLGASADDDSEVEVDPPLQECEIKEETEEQEAQRPRLKGITRKMQIPAPPPHPAKSAENTSKMTPAATPLTTPVHSPLARRDGVPPRPKQIYANQNSLDDDSDHFEEMPDSEVNIVTKVKVLMGRGQELGNTTDEPSVPDTALPVANVGEQVFGVQRSSLSMSVGSEGSWTEESTLGKESVTGQAATVQVAPPHYLVGAAVIEEESPLVRQYEDDILKLIIRLPVEGQTQNVQFDFHLVEDDPVQVAKEMVAELSIPQEAVLEISETIGGLARTARMKQDKNRQQMQMEQMMAQNTQNQSMQQPAGTMHLVQQQQPQHINQIVQVNGYPPTHVQVNGYPPTHVPAAGNKWQPATHAQMPPDAAVSSQQRPPAQAQAPNLVQPAEGLHVGYPPSQTTGGDQQQQLPVYIQATTVAASREGMPASAAQQQVQTNAPIQPVSYERTAAGGQVHVQYAAAPSEALRQPQSITQTATLVEEQSSFIQMQPQDVQPVPVRPPSETPIQPVSYERSAAGGQVHVQYAAATSEAARQPQSIAQTATQVEEQSFFIQMRPLDVQPVPVGPPSEISLAKAEAQPKPLEPRSENGRHESAGKRATLSLDESTFHWDEDSSDDDDETALKEEMRRLDEDFKKNMLRAQKVFDSRMDNLQRSKEEREAQHLKTLEKHEKERAEFEKRALQAQIEQNRRIEQLQREWDKKREKLSKHRKTESEMSQTITESNSFTSSFSREKLVGTAYRRSDSEISSSSSGDCGSNTGSGGVVT